MTRKAHPKLKPGQRVTVYLDPFTRQEPEGDAVLSRVDQVIPGTELEYWWVRFDGDDADVYRRIWVG